MKVGIESPASALAEQLLVQMRADIGDTLLAKIKQNREFGRDKVQLYQQADFPFLVSQLSFVSTQLGIKLRQGFFHHALQVIPFGIRRYCQFASMLVHPLDNIVLQEALLQFPLLSMSIRLISIKHLSKLFDFLLFLLLELLLVGTDALQFFRSLME